MHEQAKTKGALDFIHHEAAGGIALLIAAVLAMVMANTGLAWLYDGFLKIPVTVRVGALNLDKPLVLWINGEASKGCCDLKGGPYLEPKYFGDGIAIAVAKSEPQLRGEINAALRKLRASGRFEELVLRYFPFRVF